MAGGNPGRARDPHGRGAGRARDGSGKRQDGGSGKRQDGGSGKRQDGGSGKRQDGGSGKRQDGGSGKRQDGGSGKRQDGQRGRGQPGRSQRGRSQPGRGPQGRGRPDPDDTVAQLAGPLQKVLRRLPETQRRVLELRMGLVDGHPHDLADTARQLGLSMSEARDIERRAFEHIREAIPLQQLQRFLPS